MAKTIKPKVKKSKARYADGFLVPIQTKKLAAYQKVASKTAKLWKEYGAIDYKECVGDDLKNQGVASFLTQMKAKKGETIIFAWITYRSKKHRDSVNKKIITDPRLDAMVANTGPLFDSKRMVYGGFNIMVD